MPMSKKDYQAIARAIHDARRIIESPPPNTGFNIGQGLLGIAHATECIADALEDDNPRFDRKRFVEACETGTTKGMPKQGEEV